MYFPPIRTVFRRAGSDTPAMTHSCILAASSFELLRSLKRTLEPDVEVVAMVDNQVSLRDAMLALRPELVVLDLELLGTRPGKLIRVLRARLPEVRLILLATNGLPTIEDEIRGSGADRVVARDQAGTVLLGIARQVLDSRRVVEGTR